MESAYDRLLQRAGNHGIFQAKFDVIYNCILPFLWTMAYMNMIFALSLIPQHTCEIPVKPENVSEYGWKLKYIPMLHNNNKELEFSQCLLYVDSAKGNETKVCNKFSYNTTWYDSTISGDNNWVCDKELYIANIFAYTRIGEILGNIFFGWFGDIYGRRPTYIISLALLIIGRFITILAQKYYLLFVFGCIIASFPSYFATQTACVISFEISSPKRRTITATLRLVSTAVGLCVMPLIYWCVRDWIIFVVVTTSTILPFFLLSWKIIESPRWLWVQGKTKECFRVLKIIAKSNKKSPNKDNELELINTVPVKNEETFGFLALFSSCKLAINTVLQLWMWITISAAYNVILLSLGENSEGNPFLTFAIQAIIELPGNFLAAWLVDRIGRRYTCLTSLSVTTLIWASSVVCESGISRLFCYWWIRTSLVTINRLSLTVVYFTLTLLNMELYPTCLRQSGMSLSNVFANVATISSAYILFLGRRFDSRIPGLMLTIVSFVGILSSFLLPETLNAELPETLKDAQTFGIGKKFVYIQVTDQPKQLS